MRYKGFGASVAGALTLVTQRGKASSYKLVFRIPWITDQYSVLVLYSEFMDKNLIVGVVN